MLKAIELQLQGKKFEKLPQAIKVYEKIAKKYLAQPMLKSNATGLYFMASLCFLANEDHVGAKKQVKTYSIEDPAFDGSRQAELLKSMLQHI